MLEVILKRENQEEAISDTIKKQSLYNVLLLELQDRIQTIDIRAEEFAQVRRKAQIQME